MTLTTKVKAGVVAIAVVAGLVWPYVAGAYMVSIVTLAMVLALFASSINLLAGFGGLVSLGHAGIMGAAAYGVGYMAARQGAGHLEQIIVGLVIGLVVTAIFALMAMRTSKVYFLMVTLALGQIIWGIAYRSTTLGSENGLRGIFRPEAVAPYWVYYYLAFVALLAALGALWVIRRSPFGLSLRGLAESETRLRMLGYNPTLTKFYAFMLSGLFATLAGILYVYYQQFVSPAVPQFLTSARGVLMTIVGGVGTLAGPVVGAFIIVFVENIVSAYLDRWLTVLGLIFVLTIMFAPKGVVGGISQLWHRFVRGGRERPTAAAAGAAAAGLARSDGPLEPVSGGTGPPERAGPADNPDTEEKPR
jgi:branched-chain amino acid transport system permease protein